MTGKLQRIAGPVAVATGLDARMYDVVLVGEQELLGEIIQIREERAVIQVYEDTAGLKPGDPVKNTGEPLSVELGPGLLGNIYDGVQRPLAGLLEETGPFISRGAHLPGLDPAKEWTFTPKARNGSEASPGSILGHVEEVPGFIHKVLVPPSARGKISGLKAGSFKVTDTLCKVGGKEVALLQRWPVRRPRPVQEKLPPDEPLITGQRVIDVLFPVAKGGTAIIPGPFGAGKTVNQHQLAKWSDADIIVYVGCGERGNEMTEVLTEFPKLEDPRNSKPLMNRTVLIANTSNMPVAAREASIYTGVTIAEYFRDMGYNVAVMADSTSRWAEALREISSRLEEMPGEEGYPAYLASRISEFYERAGQVRPLGHEKAGSLSIIGAVSPPGGDFFEPVTQNSLRVAKVFWALDSKLAQQRHFPSVNWLESYSLYYSRLDAWYLKNVGAQWKEFRAEIGAILQEESELLELVQLVGSDALPERQQLTLHIAQLIREVILQQSAFDERDWYSPLAKSHKLMQLIVSYARAAHDALKREVPLERITGTRFASTIYSCKLAKEFPEEGKHAEDAIREIGGMEAGQ